MTHTPADRSEMDVLVEQLKEDADDFLDVANSCDMRPEDTRNWQHKLHAEKAAQAIQSLQDRVKALEGVALPEWKDFIRIELDGLSFYGEDCDHARITYGAYIKLRDAILRRASAVKDGKTINKESPGAGQGKEGEG